MSTYNVRSYGAVPDWDFVQQTGTDNLAAFQRAIQAAANVYENAEYPIRSQNAEYPIKVIAEGHFYLSDTLHIPRGVILEGCGHGHPTHNPGTLLVFPENVTGIRIHSVYDRDLPPDLAIGTVGGALTQIRHLTLHCKNNRGEPPYKDREGFAVPANGYTGHGIHASITCAIRDVTVSNFAENGIFITAEGPANPNHPQLPKYPGNAAGTHIVNTSSNDNGAHGFYFFGSDANVSLIEMCFANVNWGNGFRDEAGVGNTYVACYGQGNQGERNTYTRTNEQGEDSDPKGFSRDGRNHDFYVINDSINHSVFYGCYSEASIDHIYAPAGAIGGELGQAASFPPTPQIDPENPDLKDYFQRSDGFALSSAGVAGIGPLITDYKHDLDGPRVEIGDYTGNKRAITLITKKSGTFVDYLWLLYQPNIRERFHDWWEWQCGSSYHPLLRFPTTQSHTPHLAPWLPNGFWMGRDDLPHKPIHITAASSPPADQYSGAAQTYEKGDVVWNSEPSAGGPLGWVCIEGGTQGTPNPAQFATFGMVDSPSKAYAENKVLDRSDRYVTVTQTATTLTLPANPVDGQTHSIKTQAGVTVTVNAAAGRAIDGQLSVSLNPSENSTFRYSVAVGEWERR
jgi:hypothetical protein